MRDLNFRLLGPDDIECRPATVTEKGVSLLLYKDARCDMNILDETVGPANWSRYHKEISGNLYCTVVINTAKDDEEPNWISKEDVGTESNMEKEKGQASDAFKRACFNWGIGRELYTAPFIWIPANKCRIEKNDRGRYECRDSFRVGEIQYEGKKISFLTIVNTKRKETVWSMGNPDTQKPESETFVTEDQIKSLRSEMKRVGKSERGILDWLGVSKAEDITLDKYRLAMDTLGAH